MLDQPAPFLGNKSPRAAAKTAKGRAKVIDWLKMLENNAAKSAGRNDDMASYDFAWLWAELGLIGSGADNGAPALCGVIHVVL